MKAKLTESGLVLISENKEEDNEMMKMFNAPKSKGAMKLHGKACFKNKRGRRELLLMNNKIGWIKIFKGKTKYE